MPGTSLREFLRAYSDKRKEHVFVVEDEIDTEYEPTAYYKLLESKGNPIIWFKKIKGFEDFELVTNVMGSEDRAAFALNSEENRLLETMQKIASDTREESLGELERDAPIKEVVLTGDEADLFKLPIPKHYAEDGSNSGFGRYISSGLAVARDPSSPNTINLSYTRIQVIGPRKYAFDMGSRGHLWRYINEAASDRNRHRPLPISVLIGAHPLFYLLAASFVENEYFKARAVEDFTFTSGVVNENIPLPSDTEIVIEAEVLPGESFPEGPFGEFTGYTSRRTTGNVARVKSILRRFHPIYYDIQASNSNEHVGLFSIPRNAAISASINNFMPPGSTYAIKWPNKASHFLAMCRVQKPEPGLAKQIGLALLGMDPLFSKIVLVEERGNKNEDGQMSLESFLLNLALRGDFEKRVNVIPDVFCIKLEQASNAKGITGKMLIVANADSDGKSESSAGYQKIVDSAHKVRLVAGGRTMVVFSHSETNEGSVNVVVGSDVDLSNEDEVMWAFVTRLRPDKDVVFFKQHENSADSPKLLFRATELNSPIPTIPLEVLERVSARLARQNK
ncbi:MAG TPA: UbiD family decarboxylase domain-containing protein [Nitrososphaerales archaeon]|nr:UbiD family decarboxylase domain-containing protein [Nitrososphaerales archaeon]